MPSIRSIFRILLLALLLLLPLTNDAAAADKGNLTVTINDFKNDTGLARIAIFNNAQTYAASGYTEKGAVAAVAVPIKAAQASYTFINLPFGEYGIKVFHDKDASGVFRTNFLGIPSQGVGFSNNPSIKLGMPNYNAIKFNFDAVHQQQVINILGD